MFWLTHIKTYKDPAFLYPLLWFVEFSFLGVSSQVGVLLMLSGSEISAYKSFKKYRKCVFMIILMNHFRSILIYWLFRKSSIDYVHSMKSTEFIFGILVLFVLFFWSDRLPLRSLSTLLSLRWEQSTPEEVHYFHKISLYQLLYVRAGWSFMGYSYVVCKRYYLTLQRCCKQIVE